MNAAATARIGASLLALLAATALALAGHDPSSAAVAGWREPLQRAEAALANGEGRAAQEAWERAYRAAMQVRTTEGLLAVGDAYLRIGEAARDRATARASARRIFLTALFQARERRDAPSVAAAAAAFASLGDRDAADRGFEIATAIANRYGDVAARERIAALQTGTARAPRTP